MKKKIISVILTAVMALTSVQFIGANNVSADEPTLIGFVGRLYNVCLDRPADSEGLNYWKSTVDAKANTGISLAYDFVSSPEFQSKEMSNEDYVDHMYAALMGREADPEGRAYWTGLMANGMSRDEVFVGFANSNEFFDICNLYGVVAGTAMVGRNPHEFVGINYFTDRCYDVILGRDCDHDGMAYWSNSLATGATTGATLADSFLFSGEYISKNKTNEEYLTDLYNAMMGRGPVREELDYWISVIESGAPNRQIFADFVRAPEFEAICSGYGIIRGEVTVDVPEEPSGKLLIASWNDEFSGIVERYSDVDIETVIVGSENYQSYLDQVFASGEDAPDVFAADADYARNYICSDITIPVAELGITPSDVSQMYDYTFQFNSDNSGALKGLSWQCCPCVVFYNRSVAQRTLGVSEPEQVAQYFWSWDAVKNTAVIVNAASNGEVKIVSDYADMYRATNFCSWTVNGQVGLDTNKLAFLDVAACLLQNDLTWNAYQWGAEWTANATNERVLSYWGPMWLGKFSLGFDPNSGWGGNPTAGDWGVVCAPSSFFWGGTTVMASKYCDDKAAAGDILRDVCCNTTNLTDMALGGEFVNNNAVMVSMASNEAWNLDMLSGQNPVNYFIQSAQSITFTEMNNYNYSDAYSDTIYAYADGQTTRAQANDFFRGVLNGTVNVNRISGGFIWEASSNHRLMYDFDSTLRNQNGVKPVSFKTSDSAIVLDASYYHVTLYDKAIEDTDPDTFVVELVYENGTVVRHNVQSSFVITRTFVDDEGWPAYEGHFELHDELVPFGGAGLRRGDYALRIFDADGNCFVDYNFSVL